MKKSSPELSPTGLKKIIYEKYFYPSWQLRLSGRELVSLVKKKLEKMGHKIFVPSFPIPKEGNIGGHRLELWLKEFEKYKQYLNKDTVIIAHSRGCSFAFQALPKLGIKIDALFLVGAFVDYDQWRPDIYKEYDSFQARPYLWKQIRNLVNYVEVYQSTNDVIPVSEGKFVADCLKGQFIIVKNAGHFNVAYNKKYLEFPLLLKNIENYLNP